MNERWVTLRAPALADARFEVLSLEGEERLNTLPTLTVDLRAVDAGVEGYRDLLTTELVSLQFEEQGRVQRRFHGVVVDLELAHREEERGTMFARVRVAPRLWLLERNVGSELFVDATYPEIIAQKLEAVGLKENEDYRFALSDRYPRRELTVQYEESDLAFVQRLCEHLGIITRFEYTSDHDRWVLTDMPDALGTDEGRPPIPVRSRTDHPAAYGVTTRMKRGAQSVSVHDYNYRAPRLALLQETAGATRGALGRRVEYGAHSKDPTEARRLSALRQEALVAGSEVVTGGCSAMHLEVGQRLVLDHVELGTMELMVTALAHRGRERDGEQDWDTRFEAIPVTTPYRPRCVTPWPRIRGLINARVDGEVKGHYAELDEAGRYHVQMAFDRSGRTNRQASHPVRMAQPHTGARYGMHFPLRPGAEVLLGFVDGNPDRPVIVGTAPNPENASPVDAGNFSQNVLRTKSGNEMVIEDELGNERVRIHSPHRASTIQLGSVDEPEEGILLQTEGHISHVSRGTHNTASKSEARLTGNSVTMATEHAVFLAGLTTARNGGTVHGLDGFRDGGIGAGLRALALAPGEEADNEDEAQEEPVEGDGLGSLEPFAGLWSAMGDSVRETAIATTFEAVRALATATDETLDASLPRAQGHRLGTPMGPVAALGSPGTAALFGRDTALVYGDRVAALSSFDTASVVGLEHAELFSPGRVEVAGQTVMVTSEGELSQEAATVRVIGGYYPEAVAPALDDGTSIGVMSRHDLRITSVEDCILVCAQKNLIGSAHEGDIRLTASETVRLEGASIEGYAGEVRVEAENITVLADGDVEIEASSVTIRAPSITLDGSVTITGNLDVGGKLNVKDDSSLASG